MDILACFSVGSAVRDRIRLSDFGFGGFTGRVLCRSHGRYCGSVGGVGAKVQDVFSAVTWKLQSAAAGVHEPVDRLHTAAKSISLLSNSIIADSFNLNNIRNPVKRIC